LPFYMALILLLLGNWNEENFAAGKLGLASFIFFAIATLNLPNFNFEQRKNGFREWAKEPIEAAAYLDFKMDELGIDRYTFLGKNGSEIYGWTKHSPWGPYFFQYDIWVNDIPGFKDSIVSNVKRADAVVVTHILPEFAPEVNQILREQFTEQKINRYRVYFRKR